MFAIRILACHEDKHYLVRCWRPISLSLVCACVPISLPKHVFIYIFLKSARIIVLCIHITYITENIFAKAVVGDGNVFEAQHSQVIYSSIRLFRTNFMEYIQALVGRGTERNGVIFTREI